MSPRKYMEFVVAGSCIDGNCDCKQYDGVMSNEEDIKHEPPLHKDCQCYLAMWKAVKEN